MEIRRLEHVQLAMPKGAESAARDFYWGILGIPESEKPEHLRSRGGVWFETDTLKVHLGVDPEFSPARKAHPAFVVSDLDALAERLSSAGCTVRADVPVEGVNHFYVDDPFGNRLEFMSESDT